ncbi:hypothetical protein ACQR1I_36025 [Bradyrhizobium sp. HKCCYLS2038]|uniref:hypothetical protein n=1 Tax=Bradyrhizobium sp. HKCCYLS2038 TaxID=3420764 RepID=UPI003EB9B565
MGLDDFPVSVREAAQAAYKELAGDCDYADTHVSETTEAFAKAILAERERCARIAEAFRETTTEGRAELAAEIRDDQRQGRR